MFVKRSEAEYRDDKKYVDVTLYADTAPSPMPDPEDIPGYDETFEFMPGSTLYEITTSTVYMVGEDGDWHVQ